MNTTRPKPKETRITDCTKCIKNNQQGIIMLYMLMGRSNRVKSRRNMRKIIFRECGCQVNNKDINRN